MMRFNLRCERDHGFEAWFGGNGEFDEQSAQGLVVCPFCGSTAVTKALMAPAVSTSRRSGGDASADRPAPSVPEAATGLTNARDAALRAALREVARQVRERTVDVAERFPEEARRIHYGEAEERAIRGRASPDEARALAEEGIAIAPVPMLPDDAN